MQGVLYASGAARDTPSTILYRPFDAWAPNSDWTLTLPPGEEAAAVAAGATFAAVATQAAAAAGKRVGAGGGGGAVSPLLRLFSLAGLQMQVCWWGGGRGR